MNKHWTIMVFLVFGVMMVTGINWSTQGIIGNLSPANNTEIFDFNTSRAFSGNSSTEGSALVNVSLYHNFNGNWLLNQTVNNTINLINQNQSVGVTYTMQENIGFIDQRIDINGSGGSQDLSINAVKVKIGSGGVLRWADTINFSTLADPATVLAQATIPNPVASGEIWATFSSPIQVTPDVSYIFRVHNATGATMRSLFEDPESDVEDEFVTFIATGSRLQNLLEVEIGPPNTTDSFNWTFNSTVSFGRDKVWNAEGCAVDGTCGLSANNNTIHRNLSLPTEVFNLFSLEGEEEFFQINISVIGNPLTSGTLVHNNTRFVGNLNIVDSQNISITRTIDMPQITADTNFTFFWDLLFNDGTNINATSRQQSVNAISIDSCSANTIRILNYTLLDEELQTHVNVTTNNSRIELDVDIFPLDSTTPIIEFSENYTQMQDAIVCLDDDLNGTTFTMDVQTRYDGGSDYVTEFHYLQNVTLSNETLYRNITLFALQTDDAQEFLITFKDENFLPVADALVDIQRKYIAEGVFKSVEIPKTDTDGQTLGNFVLSDVVYNLIVSKNGVVLATFTDKTTKCENQATGDCKINLQIFSSETLPFNYNEEHGLNYTLTFNETSRTVSSIFTSATGDPLFMELNVTRFDNFGNQSLCFDSVTTSAGSLSCVVPESFGNVTLISELYADEDLIAKALFTIAEDPASVFGASRIIMVMILMVTLPLMALTSGVFTIVFVILGIIMVISLNIIEGGSFLGVNSSLLWAIVAGAIIIWKISRKD